jgi:23S rRNA (uridine2552-2'-O)-methyltransferase
MLGKSNPKIESGKPYGQNIAIDILPMEGIADFREEDGLAA